MNKLQLYKNIDGSHKYVEQTQINTSYRLHLNKYKKQKQETIEFEV